MYSMVVYSCKDNCLLSLPTPQKSSHTEAQYSDTAIVDTASDTSADNTSDKDIKTGGAYAK